MKPCIALLLCVLLPFAGLAAEKDYYYTVDYGGGSLEHTKIGEDLDIFLDRVSIRIFKGKTELASIPCESVTEISYGQDVHRRVGAAIGLAVFSFGVGALMALTKSKKHYLGLTWDESGKKGGFAFQASKYQYRGLLAGLEGLTGKKAVNSDSFTVKN